MSGETNIAASSIEKVGEGILSTYKNYIAAAVIIFIIIVIIAYIVRSSNYKSANFVVSEVSKKIDVLIKAINEKQKQSFSNR